MGVVMAMAIAMAMAGHGHGHGHRKFVKLFTENGLDVFKENELIFTKSDIFMKTKKMRAVRTIHFQAVARRDLCSEAQS